MLGNVHVKLEGNIAELAKIDPKSYENFIHTEDVKKLIM